MNKDFNVYKWRRENLTEEESEADYQAAFSKAWIKDIQPVKGERKVTYDHIVKNVPTRLYEKVTNIIRNQGFDIIDDEEFEDDDRGVMIWLYLKKH